MSTTDPRSRNWPAPHPAAPVEPTEPVPLVRCQSLSRTYGTGPQAVVAVHGATCTVPARARIAITGPSGSGKSTLLHMIAGLEPPTAGTIDWPALGPDIAHRPGCIGVVFQGPSLLPPLDVIENVALPLVLAGLSDRHARALAADALAALDIRELAAKLPEELSGGQAQRAAVARVLASRPDLVVADEPTGQLDHPTAAQVMAVLLAAADDIGAAVVVATHDPRIADLLATRWQVHDGALVTDSPRRQR